MEARIAYKNGRACFTISRESEGLFTAHLVSFDGNGTPPPPYEITLLKGIRNWTGSVEDDVLLDELGKFINSNWVAADERPLRKRNHGS